MTTLLARVVLGAGVAVALSLLGPATAEAQPAPGTPAPTAAQMDAARKLVNDGIAAQNAKDYDKAIELYKKAYAIVPHPILMFNIGQALRLAGRHDQAVPFYERYLGLEPNGAEAPAARAALAEIKAAPKPAEPGKPAEPPKPSEPGKSTEPGPRPAPPPTMSEGAPPPAAGPTTSPMPGLGGPDRTDTVSSPGRTLRLTGIALAGVGLASAAAGVYFTTRVRHWEGEAQDRADQGATDAELEAEFGSKGRAAERNQFISYAVGGALVAGGAVTYWLGLRKDEAASTTAWAPVVGPGFTGIAISGSLP